MAGGRMRLAAKAKERKLVRKVTKAVLRKGDLGRTYQSGTASIDYSGTIYSTITVPSQGDGENQRAKDQILPERINLAYSVGVASTTNTLRVIVFVWKVDDSEEVPVPAAILEGAILSSSQAPFAPYVIGVNRKKFTVKHDKLYSLGQGNQIRHWKGAIKLSGKILFNPAATTGRNKIYMLVISDDGAVSYPGFTYALDFQYRD